MIPSTYTESEFTSQVLDLARLCGWTTLHIRPARTAKGWRTPVQGDGVGFPDLTLVRGSVLRFAELKSEGGKLRPEQEAWLAKLAQVREVQASVWRPGDWREIEGVLR